MEKLNLHVIEDENYEERCDHCGTDEDVGFVEDEYHHWEMMLCEHCEREWNE